MTLVHSHSGIQMDAISIIEDHQMLPSSQGKLKARPLLLGARGQPVSSLLRLCRGLGEMFGRSCWRSLNCNPIRENMHGHTRVVAASLPCDWRAGSLQHTLRMCFSRRGPARCELPKRKAVSQLASCHASLQF